MFAVYNGPKGIAKMADRTHRLAQIFAAAVKGFGYDVVTSSFFDTVTIHAPGLSGTPRAGHTRRAVSNAS